MSDASEIRGKLRQIGHRRKRAAKTNAETMEDIRAIAPKARAAGLTKVEIAALAHVSRPQLDTILKP